ncbi:DNA polymerase III subunit delta [Solibaculum mannosilyticum]|uniref:DNA polymerase III subunit delta n=1 Tax=Solibaculum mannosilyticum TaxID=2780922 RepID=UPI0007A852AC|nr:DNA polymerase III subunit delta [Eubacteriaceae bacterium CHKCI005]
MPGIGEVELKKQIQTGELASVYLLYGDEQMLKKHYSQKLVSKAVAKGMEQFNLMQFYWKDTSMDEVVDAVETLPVMAERRCVVLIDLDAESLKAADQEKLTKLLKDPPDTCVLIVRLDAVQCNPKKSAKWRSLIKKIDSVGCTVQLDHRDMASLSKLLCSSALKRGCTLTPHVARYLVELCGNDLQALSGELDKVCSMIGEGEITRKDIDMVAVPTLESSVFDLSRAITKRDISKAFSILDTLLNQKEEPVAILSVLCMGTVDLYRAKVASLGGSRAEDLAKDFNYRGKEFRLRNAARDAARLDIDRLREQLDILYEADRKLKGSRVDGRVVLEQTIVQLMA